MSGVRDTGEDRLDGVLAGLARELPPERDLWPTIAAQLEPRRAATRWPAAAAAAVLLVVASSLITAHVMRREVTTVAIDAPAPAPTSTPVVQPAAFGPGHALDREYVAARQQLAATLAARIDRLPNSARQKVEDNLAQMQRAADEINAALALQPGDALLEELLLNTYQDELAVLASVNQLANLNGAGAPEDEGTRL